MCFPLDFLETSSSRGGAGFHILTIQYSELLKKEWARSKLETVRTCGALHPFSLEPPEDQPWKKVVWLAGLKHTAVIPALQIRSGEFGESIRNDEEDT